MGLKHKIQHCSILVKMEKSNDQVAISDAMDKLSIDSRLVLNYLLNKKSPNQECRYWHISVVVMIKEIGIGRDRIFSSIKELRDKGHLVKSQRRGERGKIIFGVYVVSELPINIQQAEQRIIEEKKINQGQFIYIDVSSLIWDDNFSKNQEPVNKNQEPVNKPTKPHKHCYRKDVSPVPEKTKKSKTRNRSVTGRKAVDMHVSMLSETKQVSDIQLHNGQKPVEQHEYSMCQKPGTGQEPVAVSVESHECSFPKKPGTGDQEPVVSAEPDPTKVRRPPELITYFKETNKNLTIFIADFAAQVLEAVIPQFLKSEEFKNSLSKIVNSEFEKLVQQFPDSRNTYHSDQESQENSKMQMQPNTSPKLMHATLGPGSFCIPAEEYDTYDDYIEPINNFPDANSDPEISLIQTEVPESSTADFSDQVEKPSNFNSEPIELACPPDRSVEIVNAAMVKFDGSDRAEVKRENLDIRIKEKAQRLMNIWNRAGLPYAEDGLLDSVAINLSRLFNGTTNITSDKIPTGYQGKHQYSWQQIQDALEQFINRSNAAAHNKKRVGEFNIPLHAWLDNHKGYSKCIFELASLEKKKAKQFVHGELRDFVIVLKEKYSLYKYGNLQPPRSETYTVKDKESFTKACNQFDKIIIKYGSLIEPNILAKLSSSSELKANVIIDALKINYPDAHPNLQPNWLHGEKIIDNIVQVLHDRYGLHQENISVHQPKLENVFDWRTGLEKLRKEQDKIWDKHILENGGEQGLDFQKLYALPLAIKQHAICPEGTLEWWDTFRTINHLEYVRPENWVFGACPYGVDFEKRAEETCNQCTIKKPLSDLYLDGKFVPRPKDDCLYVSKSEQDNMSIKCKWVMCIEADPRAKEIKDNVRADPNYYKSVEQPMPKQDEEIEEEVNEDE